MYQQVSKSICRYWRYLYRRYVIAFRFSFSVRSSICGIGSFVVNASFNLLRTVNNTFEKKFSSLKKMCRKTVNSLKRQIFGERMRAIMSPRSKSTQDSYLLRYLFLFRLCRHGASSLWQPAVLHRLHLFHSRFLFLFFPILGFTLLQFSHPTFHFPLLSFRPPVLFLYLTFHSYLSLTSF